MDLHDTKVTQRHVAPSLHSHTHTHHAHTAFVCVADFTEHSSAMKEIVTLQTYKQPQRYHHAFLYVQVLQPPQEPLLAASALGYPCGQESISGTKGSFILQDSLSLEGIYGLIKQFSSLLH